MAKNVGRLRTKQIVFAASRGKAEKVVQQAEILHVEFRIEAANEWTKNIRSGSWENNVVDIKQQIGQILHVDQQSACTKRVGPGENRTKPFGANTHDPEIEGQKI